MIFSEEPEPAPESGDRSAGRGADLGIVFGAKFSKPVYCLGLRLLRVSSLVTRWHTLFICFRITRIYFKDVDKHSNNKNAVSIVEYFQNKRNNMSVNIITSIS